MGTAINTPATPHNQPQSKIDRKMATGLMVKTLLTVRDYTGIKTQKALIDHALRELLRHENQIKILELKGTVNWDGNVDEWRRGRSL